jgi:hypothetical protein
VPVHAGYCRSGFQTGVGHGVDLEVGGSRGQRSLRGQLCSSLSVLKCADVGFLASGLYRRAKSIGEGGYISRSGLDGPLKAAAGLATRSKPNMPALPS